MVKLEQDMLQAVEKPARYTGGEWNAQPKDSSAVLCRIALAMADVYEVGMSNLGLKILYEILNRRDDIAAERVYAPWLDMEAEMRRRNIPLFSLETFREISSFDIVGFSLQYELLITNTLNMLDLAGIPLHAAERTDEHPFVIGGGPCVYNTEPIADFFDFFVLGDGEEIVVEVCDAWLAWKKEGRLGGRSGFLRRVANVAGVYVPSFYAPEYDETGMFTGLRVLDEAAPLQIHRRIVRDLDAAPFLEKPIVPYLGVVHDRLMLELFRGCTRGCRFCQAGMAYRPVRERRPETLKRLARTLFDATGYNEMSLTSLSSADYSCLAPLVDELLKDTEGERVSFSLPSLRIDSFSVDIAERLQQVRKSSLTFAPEAGTQRLRDVINKNVTEDDLLHSVRTAFEQGWKAVKLYFMMGLPTERDEDVVGIAELAQKVVDCYKEVKGKRGVRVTVSVSCFVPKAYTPFQWFAQVPQEEFERRQQLLKASIRDRAISFHYHDARASVLEGALSRGDRRLAPVIETAWRNGAKFDGWTDQFKDEVWKDAFQSCGVAPEFYSRRTRDLHEALPWAHTSPGVSQDFLRREWQRAQEAALTHDCRRESCMGCGVCPALHCEVVDWRAEA